MKKLLTIITLAISAMTMMADSYRGTKFYHEDLEYEIISDSTGYAVEVIGKKTSSQSVVIPASVTYQGMNLPVKNIGQRATLSLRYAINSPLKQYRVSFNAPFRYQSSLTSVTLPNSIIHIGNWAFYSCSSLTSINIPNSVKSIGDNAFDGCSALISVTIPNSVELIGWEAFLDCKSLKSVTIPNGVTHIMGKAFRGCTSLTSITIPNSVKRIWEETFYGCSSLKSVTIPDGVTHIGKYAFAGCDSLTSVRIPTSVIEIEEGAFPEHTEITRVEILSFKYKHNGITHSFTSSLPSRDSVFADAKIFSIGPLTYKTTSSTTAEVCDADEDITRVSIPTTVTNDHTTYHVTRIGKEAFKYCAQLTSVTIPNSVTEIGNLAFGGCYSLTSITIPNSVKKIGRYAFIKCSALTNATIPNSLKSIGYNAFSYCSSLSSITIPNSVTSIEQGAFYECSALTSVTIPNSVTSIADGAFRRTALYNNPANWKNGVLYLNDCLIAIDSTFTQVRSRSIFDEFFNDGKKYAIKENTRLIADRAFKGCKSLTSVTIPYGVTHIGESAFQDCKSLTSVTIPNSVTHIGESAFYKCSAITSVTIPNSVTEIREGAFCGCTSLRSITTPRSLVSKGKSIFCDSFDFATIHYSETESSSNNSPTYKYQTEEEPLIIRKVQLQEDGVAYSIPAVEGQLVLMFDEDMSHEESNNMLKEKGLSIISSIPELNYYLVQVPVGEEGQYFSQLNDNDLVDYVYPNAIEYFCSASAYALDDYVYTDHGRRVSKMLTGCDPMMDKAGCDPLVNLEEKNVADSVGNFIQNTIDSTLALILLPLPKDSFNDKVVINMSFGPRLYNKDGEYEGVKWDNANVTEDNRLAYRRSYVNALKRYINLVKKFDKEDFVIVKGASNEGMKQLETIIDELTSELTWDELKVFERHFILVSAKDDYTPADYPNDVSRYHKMVSKVDISDMTRQDTAWAGTSFSSPRLAGYIYKLAVKYDLPATTVLRFVRSATEKATDNVVTYELIEQEIANANRIETGFVDLGLPSGTLWKAINEPGLYTYQEANDKFVSEEEHLPTYEQLFELKQECQWGRTDTGYELLGPNGNSITFSAEGYVDCGGTHHYANGGAGMFGTETIGMIWSSTPTDADKAYSMGIGTYNPGTIQSDNRCYGRSVHLVQSVEKEIEKEEENVADNIITYTSSDGDIINPKTKYRYGGTIVSNTYENGKGTIVFDRPVTSIRQHEFSSCSTLTSVTLPNGVKEIESGAFYNCSSLTSITIPNSVTRIAESAFMSCKSLTSITIPNSVTRIASHTFQYCYSLTSITIPSSVMYIDMWAFFDCKSLTSVTILNSKTSIEGDAFPWYTKIIRK